MPPFNANSHRYHELPNYKFLVIIDGQVVAGVSKVSALTRTTEVIKHRAGADPRSLRKSPGRSEYEPITLERGKTYDVAFEQWANKVWNYGSGLGAESPECDMRKNIIIQHLNEAGQVPMAYKIFNCWVSEFQTLADLDANANAIAIEMMKLGNEGWERDYDTLEPTESSVLEPQ